MAQETELWEKETHREGARTKERKKDESATGRDLPRGDGDVGEEQVDAISGARSDRPAGQDHSTEHHEQRDPTSGVGAIQDSEDISSDIFRNADS